MNCLSEQYKAELTQFITNNYINTIIEQINYQDCQVKTILLTFDLSLIIDTRPLLGSWIINFYPHFLQTVHSIVYQLISPIEFDGFYCDVKFISVPSFETAIHDPAYKLVLIDKNCGSLIHIKNAVIVSIDKPKTYLQLQEYRCRCDQKVYIKTHHLIQRLKYNQENQLEQCNECGADRIEVDKKYKACQRILLHLQDLSPFNKKYGNMRQNHNKYRHSCQLMEMYLDGNNIQKYTVGQQIYSLAYYSINLTDSIKQKRHYLNTSEYCYAVTIDQYMAVQNKQYFNQLKMQFRYQQSQQLDYDDNFTEDIKILLDQNRRHYSYGKDNKQYVHETLNTLVFIANSQGNDVINSKSMFPLKITLLLSIILENNFNLPYYLSNSLNSRSNVLVQKVDDQQLQQQLNIAIIYEDSTLLFDLIKSMTHELDNIIWLPIDCDEESFDHILLNMATGGILVVANLYNKSIRAKLTQILLRNSVSLFKQHHIQIKCTIWYLIDCLATKKNKDDVYYLYNSCKEMHDCFDIVIDISYSNLVQKQVRFTGILDYIEQITNIRPNTNMFNYQTTIKKNYIAQPKSFSSCYLIQQQKFQDKVYNQDIDEWLKKLKAIDQSALEMLNGFFIKFRQATSCSQQTLHSLIKIATASTLLRHFIYTQVDDHDGLFTYLLTQKNTIPISYADSLLSILFVLETRINTQGPSGAIFGSDTTNYLFNIQNLQFQFKENRLSDNDNNALFEQFSILYDKILNFIN